MTLEQLLGLMAFGVKKGTSDIHLEAGYPPSYRLRGELVTAKMERLTPADTLLLAQHILGKDDPFFAGARHDVDRGFSIQGVSRFRASIFRQRGEGIRMREEAKGDVRFRALEADYRADLEENARQPAAAAPDDSP